MSGIQQALFLGGNSGSRVEFDSFRFLDIPATQSSLTLANLPDKCTVFLCYMTVASSNQNLSVSTAGWTKAASLYANDSADTNFGVSYRYFTSGGNKTVSLNTSCFWGAVVLLNANNDDLLTDTVKTATGVNSPSPKPPTVSGKKKNAFILCFGASNNGGGAYTTILPEDGPFEYLADDVNESRMIGTGIKGNAVIAVYDDSMFDKSFTTWGRGAEVPSDCSWCAVTIGVQ